MKGPAQFRVVTNGDKFRVQGRERCQFGPFGWWSSWTDLGGAYLGPFWSVREYETESEARGAIKRATALDALKRRPWLPLITAEWPR